MKNAIVIGTGYGDEGKGLTVDWLASTFEYSTVVRYSGGSQCGHGVRHKKKDNPDGLFHEFQTWGSGTLHCVNTFLTKDVVFDPISIWKEYLVLKEKCQYMPIMYIDPHAAVITPYDVYLNQNSSKNLSDGTCGKGIFATKQRERNHHHIHMIDLLYPNILQLKMQELKKAYKFPIKLENDELYDIDLTEFYHSISKILSKSNIFRVRNQTYFKDCNLIYESSQGLMLDESIGIYPYCTPSKLDIPHDANVSDIFLVTRAYHSRHGNGPLTTEQFPVPRSKWETNFDNAYQGNFRTGILDLDVLSYAIESSNVSEYREQNKDTNINLVITHLDVVQDSWKLFYGGHVYTCFDKNDFVMKILKYLSKFVNISKLFINDSPFAGNITEFNTL